MGRLVLASLMLAVGCAQGGGEEDAGTPPPPPPRDTGTPPPPGDSGVDPPTGCDDDEGHGRACMAATDLGPLMPGQMKTSMSGILPADNPEDWLTIQFPQTFEMSAPMQGMGRPRIEFSLNEGDAFRFEVFSECGTTYSCDSAGEIPARDLTEWDFIDDPMVPDMTEFLSRDIPWVETIRVRVYRAMPGVGCPGYQLQVSR